MKKKKKPHFKVPNLGVKKRVKDRWRRPRGIDNKKRIGKKSAGPSPNIGYKNPDSIRHMHPCGKKELLVENLNQIEEAKGQDVVLRIAKKVGKRKRALLLEKAKEFGLKVVN